MATTTPVVKLMCGARELNINDAASGGHYKIGTDFVPPETILVPQYAVGTSANRREGGQRVNDKAVDRDWSFSIHIVNCASDAEMHGAIRNLSMMLALAGDESQPLYLATKPNSDTAYEPLWGNGVGCFMRYEILFGTSPISEQYGVTDKRAKALANGQVRLRIKPYAWGKLNQRVAQAYGGLVEDVIGSALGTSKGLMVPEATTNLFTSPVFGYNYYLTWDFGWTFGSSLTVVVNYDDEFCLPGVPLSVYATARATSNNTVTQSLTLPASSHMISCYAKLMNGGAVSSTHLQIYYNSAAQTTTFFSVGNGWYRCVANVTGTGGPLATGIVVKNGYSVFVSGFQAEQKASTYTFGTPLCYGDMPGCAWGGVLHSATSTRTAARVRVLLNNAEANRNEEVIKQAAGGVRVVLRMNTANTHLAYQYIFDVRDGSHTSVLAGYFEGAADDNAKFHLNDGTNNAATAAQTFAIGDVIVLHMVWSKAGGIIIYKNGAVAASNATYALGTSFGANLYIGTDYLGGNNALFTFMDFTVFDQAPTATEVLNDYNTVSAAANDGQRVSTIPWEWTKDGDDAIDNANDSGRNNFWVVGGLPGSEPVDYVAVTLGSHDDSASTDTGYYWNVYATPLGNYFPPDTKFYVDKSGAADATASGGAVNTQAISTTPVGVGSLQVYYLPKNIHKFTVAARLSDAGSNLQIALRSYYPTAALDTNYISVSTGGVYKIVATPSLFVRRRTKDYFDNIWFYLLLKRTTGSANVSVDYYQVLPGEVFRVAPPVDSGSGAKTGLVPGKVFVAGTSQYFPVSLGEGYYPSGDPTLNLLPNMLNVIANLRYGGTGGAPIGITSTLTIKALYITPRYALV